jgi:hypothetical protein
MSCVSSSLPAFKGINMTMEMEFIHNLTDKIRKYQTAALRYRVMLTGAIIRGQSYIDVISTSEHAELTSCYNEVLLVSLDSVKKLGDQDEVNPAYVNSINLINHWTKIVVEDYENCRRAYVHEDRSKLSLKDKLKDLAAKLINNPW